MNIRLIAFQGQRLSHSGLLIELWFHVLVCAIDQQPSTASLLNLRMILAHCAHQMKLGEDLDLDYLLEQPEQIQELLALCQFVVHRLPSEPLALIPPIFLSSIAPQGGFWSGDYDTFDFESRRLQLLGQSFMHLLRGTLPAPPGAHKRLSGNYIT